MYKNMWKQILKNVCSQNLTWCELDDGSESAHNNFYYFNIKMFFLYSVQNLQLIIIWFYYEPDLSYRNFTIVCFIRKIGMTSLNFHPWMKICKILRDAKQDFFRN